MSRPNILHIFTDQQRHDTIRALGNPVMQTPNLDWLVRQGTSFTSTYTPAAECVPARACMITGMYADRTGCFCNEQSMPSEDHPTLMSLLADGGYRTHGVGKCHFTPDRDALRGFQSRDKQEEFTDAPETDDYLSYVKRKGFNHVLEPHGVRGDMYYIPQPNALPQEHHHTAWTADRSIAFMKRQARSRKPWYLYAGFIHPHPPFSPPNPWHKIYRAPDMPLPHLPASGEDLHCFINRFQNRYKFRDRGLDMNLIRCIRAYYAACVTFIDYQLGRMLKQLAEMGELDNTLILFSSDHGELLGDFGCFGKRSFHDAAQRVPLVVRQPRRFRKGNICAAPASLVDFLPTFLETAGLSVPPEADGVNLAGLARGKSRRSEVHFHYNKNANAIHGVVTADWKYAWSAPDQKEFLFRREDSPETRNLAGQASARKTLGALRETAQARAALFPSTSGSLNRQGNWKRYPRRHMPKDPDAMLLFQDPPNANPVLPAGYRMTYPR